MPYIVGEKRPDSDYTGDPRKAPAGTVVQQWPDGSIISDGNGKFYQIKNGAKSYVPPASVMQGYHPSEQEGRDLTPQEIADRTPASQPGKRFLHTRGEFDPATGGSKTNIDWGDVLSLVVGGVLTAGAASALMGGGAGAEAAASTAAATGSTDAGLAAGAAAGGIGGGGAAAGGVGIGETAAASGLTGSGLAGSAGGIGATGVGAGGAGAVTAAGGAAALPSSTIAPLSTTLPVGSAGSGAVAGATPAIGGASTLSRVGEIARGVGSAVSNASSAAGANRREDTQIGQNAQRAYETSLDARAKLEADQRKQAEKDIYRSSFFRNERPGPYDARGLAPVSPEYLSTLSELERQGVARLQQTPQYDTRTFNPLVERNVPDASGLEKTGSWVGPTLSTIGGLVASYYGAK